MAERVVKVRLSAEVAQYAQAMQQAADKTRAVGAEAEKAAQKREDFQKLGSVLLGVGGTMTALTLAVAKTGIEYNTLQQTSRAALTTLLGGAKAANEQMDKLDAFARTSPFSKATFITAQQQMLAFGVETKKVIPYLDAIQDAVAAAGGGNQELSEIAFIMAQISSAGKITAQDLMQFGQRGVNAAELIGSQMGKTGAEIRDQITDGALGADQALDALAAGMKQRFDGAAENVKQTFSGAMDRVQAAWRDLSADLMKPLVDPNGGGALVDFLNWTADIMRSFQALPEPIKLTGGALFAFAGFVSLAAGAIIKLAPKVAEMWQSFQNLSGAMRGIGLAGGIAMIALTAIVAVVGSIAAAQAEASAKAEAYADTLATGTQKVTAATRELVAESVVAEKSLLWMSRGSMADAATELGLGIDTVTDAILGNADALDQVNAAIEDGMARGSKALVSQTDADVRASRAADLLKESLEGEIGALDQAAEKARKKEEATSASAEVSGTAAEAYKLETDAVAELASELQGLVDTINAANGVGQDAISANAKYQGALAGVSAEVEKQKAAYEEANGTLDGFRASLDQATATGSSNASMLANLARSAQDAAAAQFEQDQATMSADEAANKYIGTLSSQRQAFIDAAVAAGFSKNEVVKLADQVFKLPSKKDIRVIAQTAQAQRDIDNFVNRNGNKTINVWLNPQTQAMNDAFATYLNNQPGHATGGPVIGPGTGTSDSILRRLSNGEHVLTAAEVQAAGGHAAIKEWRAGLVSGRGMGNYVPSAPQYTVPPSMMVQPVPQVSLDGLSISGRLEIGGDGLARIVDGRIRQASSRSRVALENGSRG